MKQNSIKFNSVIYSIKRVVTVLIPMITIPYVLRVLGVTNVGRYNFVCSIVSYFSLLAAFGIGDYGKRDGAVIRSDRKKFSEFASELFSLNIIMTFFAYLLLAFCVCTVPRLERETGLIFIFSVTIFLSTIGVEWIYIVYEDYIYITVRQILLQIVSLICIFLFVKNQDDVIMYTVLNAMSSAGANIWNFFRVRKYCDIKFTLHIHWRKHLSKSIVFFSELLMITIYVNTDQTIIGFICGDYNVGLYSTAVNVYQILGSILTSAAVVGCVKLSEYVGNHKKQEYIRAATDIYYMILTITLPCVVGVCFFCKQIVLVIAGKAYEQAYTALFILAITLIAFVLAVFWGQCVLVVNGKERILFFITIGSALLNAVLNFILIPIFKQDAAAFTTLIGEGFTAVFSIIYGRRLIRFNGCWKIVCKCLVGCSFIMANAILIKSIIKNQIAAMLVCIVMSVCGYLLIEIILKNEAIIKVKADTKS